mmetsp:Transcript_99680/g.168159  ORF Transcript_99680/g.168159 Transcript_99680/m.168159 type:complete len:308 (+) Transcript_99680:1776-2699(+)
MSFGAVLYNLLNSSSFCFSLAFSSSIFFPCECPDLHSQKIIIITGRLIRFHLFLPFHVFILCVIFGSFGNSLLLFWRERLIFAGPQIGQEILFLPFHDFQCTVNHFLDEADHILQLLTFCLNLVHQQVFSLVVVFISDDEKFLHDVLHTVIFGDVAFMIKANQIADWNIAAHLELFLQSNTSPFPECFGRHLDFKIDCHVRMVLPVIMDDLSGHELFNDVFLVILSPYADWELRDVHNRSVVTNFSNSTNAAVPFAFWDQGIVVGEVTVPWVEGRHLLAVQFAADPFNQSLRVVIRNVRSIPGSDPP